MKVKIKQIDNTKRELDISPTSTVIQLKYQLQDILSIPIEQQRLIYNGHPLVDNQTLHKIHEGDTIYIMRQLS
jgi:Ubiquitin family